MPKQLKSLRWKPAWVTHMGCLAGCTKYLKLDLSPAWLYGGTGHAFIINISPDACPSGPTAWDTRMLFGLGSNLGYKPEVAFGLKRGADFAAKQEAAWTFVRERIDRGLPCYGWELDRPEFYVIYGYDDVGYLYRGPLCQEGAGPKPWQALGDSSIGVLEVYSIERGEAAPDAKVVADALDFAYHHAQPCSDWRYPRYAGGPTTFEAWAAGLERGEAHRFGQGYNGEVWRECREMAVEFLKEARRRLPGKADAAFDEAMEHYTASRDALRQVVKLLPFQPDTHDGQKVKSPEGAALLRQAAAAERLGIEILRRIVGEI